MSGKTTPSLSQGATPQSDEAELPKGNCRYILLLPEIKGQRCACVSFTRNHATPGATCECGHLACFHNKAAEHPADSHHEVELLRQRLQLLEDRAAREQDDGLQRVVARVSELEGLVDTRTDEMAQEIGRTYGNLRLAWHSIVELQRGAHQADHRFRFVDERLARVGAELERLHHRQLELNDADVSLEERVAELEEDGGGGAPDDALDDAPPGRLADPPARQRPSSVSTSHPQMAGSALTAIGAPMTAVRQAPTPLCAAPMAPGDTWTVHISLLPTCSQPFPFERNTNAYKRCLSRGLHQMVVIHGTGSEAVVSAVSSAFRSLLRGRPWMPLQAKLCDAEQLQGLPMLRPLDPALADCRCDAEFLRRHCAVLDMTGRIDSLYIAMRHDKLSWHALRRAAPYLEGLEASWAYDPLLDPSDPFDEDDEVDDDDRPSAGDLLPPAASFPSLKRGASEISRSSSFGAAAAVAPAAAPAAGEAAGGGAGEGSGSRAKAARIVCPMPDIAEVRRRGVETA